MNMAMPVPTEAEQLAELIELCAVDGEMFEQTFFPKTVRQASAPFHQEVWKLLDSNNRLINIQVFRDGAKTTKLRIYTAKRIAYGLAHTILYIGKSQEQALRSVKWIRTAVEFNHAYRSVFKLKPGKKWQDGEAETWHGTDEYPITILGMGITGSIRGINLDDYRPDLIIIDDVIDEENSATKEQREKINDLILGSLKNSLAPASEAPDAKLVMLQTPLDEEDASCMALSDSEWTSAVFPCWTAETIDLPLVQQESAWPARYPSAVYREEKQAAIARNKLSLWLREMECTLVSPETAAFRKEWLKYYKLLPEHMTIVIFIDPVPPPTTIQIAKGMRGKDYESFAVVGKHKGDYYLLDTVYNRGHEPDWTVNTFFELCTKWRPRTVVVETVAYQQTLSWLLKKAMQVRRQYFVIKEYKDRRKKFDRIVDGLSGVASNGHLFVHAEQHEFITQFTRYPAVKHDDVIESVAGAVSELEGPSYMLDDDGDWGEMLDESNIPALTYAGGSP